MKRRGGAFILCVAMLGGCAGPLVHDARPLGSQPDVKTFTLDPEGGAARDGVIAALQAHGWHEAATGRYLVEIAFSVRPAAIKVRSADLPAQATTGAAPPFRLCKPMTLSVDIEAIDAANGHIVASSRASQDRCGAASPERVRRLAAVAVDDLVGGSPPPANR